MSIEVYTNVLKKVDNTKTVLYTCPAQKSAVIHGFNCSNIGSSRIWPSFFLRNFAQHEFILGREINIPPRTTLAWDKPINLRSGESVLIHSDSPLEDINAHLQLSIMELYDNVFERYTNSCVKLETTQSTQLYNCPSRRANAIVHGLQFANIVNTHTTINLSIVDEESESYVIGQDIKVPPRSIFVWDKTINLKPDQKLFASSTNANSIHVVCSMLEIDNIIF